MPPKLSNQDYQIRLKRGTAAKLTANEDTYGLQGEPFYATDTRELYIHDGTEYVDIYGHSSAIVTTDTSLGARHGVVMADASSGTIDLDLPALGTYPNKIYTLIGYDATNTITVNTDSGSEYIKRIKSDTLTSDTLASGDIYKIKDVGTHWQLI